MDLFFRWGKRYREIHPPGAIAAHYGFGREGGNRNFSNDSTESNHSIDPLERALRLSFDNKTGAGYFVRAESFFNTTSYMDNLGQEPAPHSPPVNTFYGGRSLHSRSHGETFFTLLDLNSGAMACFCWMSRCGTSPQRQLAFLGLIHDVLRKHKDAPFINFQPFSDSARISCCPDIVVR
jgi:predicted ATPase